MNARHFIICGSMASLGLAVTGCTATANIHDNTVNIPNAMVDVTTNADVDNVMPDQTIPIAVTVQNVYLIEPGMTPPPEHVADAGHLQIYLDDVSMPPLVVTAQVNVDVKIPPETKAGGHKLICRLHRHDGTPSSTKFEISINVKVTVAVGTVDASVATPDTGTADAGGTADDAAATN
jgi:hypothetical protein